MTAHAEFLRAASDDEALARQVKADFRKADLPERDRSMLEFAEKLSLAPWAVANADRQELCRAGWSDLEVLHIVLGCAHFNYLNRMADGLGIRLEYESRMPAFTPEDRQHAPVEASVRDEAPGQERDSGGPGEPEDLFRALAGNPEAARLTREWHAFQLRPTPGLDARRRARIALYVASLEGCAYGVDCYRRLLGRLGDDPTHVASLARGEVPEDASDRLLLGHAARLTREPWKTRESHLDELRGAGLDDTEILRLTMVVSYMSYEDRATQGLGLLGGR